MSGDLFEINSQVLRITTDGELNPELSDEEQAAVRRTVGVQRLWEIKPTVGMRIHPETYEIISGGKGTEVPEGSIDVGSLGPYDIKGNRIPRKVYRIITSRNTRGNYIELQAFGKYMAQLRKAMEEQCVSSMAVMANPVIVRMVTPELHEGTKVKAIKDRARQFYC